MLMFLRELPWLIISWLTGMKAREASRAYDDATGALDAGFSTLSNAQRKAVEATSPEIQALRKTALRTWAITFALQFIIFISVAGLALRA